MSPPPEGTFHPLLPSRAAPAPRFSQGFLRTSENPWPRSPRWGPVGRESRAPPLTHLPQGAAHHGEVPGEGFLGNFPFVEVRGKRRGDQSPSLPRERESFPLHRGGAAGAAGPFRFFPAPLLRIEPEKTQGQHLNSRHN